MAYMRRKIPTVSFDPGSDPDINGLTGEREKNPVIAIEQQVHGNELVSHYIRDPNDLKRRIAEGRNISFYKNPYLSKDRTPEKYRRLPDSKRVSQYDKMGKELTAYFLARGMKRNQAAEYARKILNKEFSKTAGTLSNLATGARNALRGAGSWIRQNPGLAASWGLIGTGVGGTTAGLVQKYRGNPEGHFARNLPWYAAIGTAGGLARLNMMGKGSTTSNVADALDAGAMNSSFRDVSTAARDINKPARPSELSRLVGGAGAAFEDADQAADLLANVQEGTVGGLGNVTRSSINDTLNRRGDWSQRVREYLPTWLGGVGDRGVNVSEFARIDPAEVQAAQDAVASVRDIDNAAGRAMSALGGVTGAPVSTGNNLADIANVDFDALSAGLRRPQAIRDAVDRRTLDAVNRLPVVRRYGMSFGNLADITQDAKDGLLRLEQARLQPEIDRLTRVVDRAQDLFRDAKRTGVGENAAFDAVQRARTALSDFTNRMRTDVFTPIKDTVAAGTSDINAQLASRTRMLDNIQRAQAEISPGIRGLELARAVQREGQAINEVVRQGSELAGRNAAHFMLPLGGALAVGAAAQNAMGTPTSGPISAMSNLLGTSNDPASDAVSPHATAIRDHFRRNLPYYGVAAAAALPLAYHIYKKPTQEEMRIRGRV